MKCLNCNENLIDLTCNKCGVNQEEFLFDNLDKLELSQLLEYIFQSVHFKVEPTILLSIMGDILVYYTQQLNIYRIIINQELIHNIQSLKTNEEALLFVNLKVEYYSNNFGLREESIFECLSLLIQAMNNNIVIEDKYQEKKDKLSIPKVEKETVESKGFNKKLFLGFGSSLVVIILLVFYISITSNGVDKPEEVIEYELVEQKDNVESEPVDQKEDVESKPDEQKEEFEFSNGVITGYNGTGGYIIIPEFINNQPVEEIASNAFNNKNILGLVIPKTVWILGTDAFANNPIRQLTVEGERARFYDVWEQSGLPIDYLYGPVWFGDFEITYDTITNYEGSNEYLVIPSKGEFEVSKIKMNVFRDRGIKTIVIPETIVEIGDKAFSDNPFENIVVLGDVNRFNDSWTTIGFPENLHPDPSLINSNDSVQSNDSNVIINSLIEFSYELSRIPEGTLNVIGSMDFVGIAQRELPIQVPCSESECHSVVYSGDILIHINEVSDKNAHSEKLSYLNLEQYGTDTFMVIKEYNRKVFLVIGSRDYALDILSQVIESL